MFCKIKIVLRCSEISLRDLSDLFPYQTPRELILVCTHQWLWLTESGSYSVKELNFAFHNPPIREKQLIWLIMVLTSNAKCSILSLLGLKPTSSGKACKVGVQSL